MCLFAGIRRKNKLVTLFASVEPRTVQSSLIYISDDSDCEDIAPKKVRKTGYHGTFFRSKLNLSLMRVLADIVGSDDYGG